MKQEFAPNGQHDTNESFAQIIDAEFGPDVRIKAFGEVVIRQTIPFGDQFMSPLPNVTSDPRATTPGGRTATTDRGVASLDDSSSSDVA